ncbi:MAG: isoprenyl transferase [Pirellulaceae bacterium]|nr:isoprenyl transferase [Pirellulaceae bacterium]
MSPILSEKDKQVRLSYLEEHGLSADRLPRHIALIMDGNGRWAQRQGLPRIEGHRRGVQAVRDTIEESIRLGIEQITLYCLSSENWKRPQPELDFLMHLLEQYMIEQRQLIMDQEIKVQVIGKRQGITGQALKEMDRTVEMSKENTKLTLCLAINYGSRAEIVDAVKSIAASYKNGNISLDQIDENLLADRLYTAKMPDPDLLIRTAGEMRVSNYLLWQISYSEFWVTEACWPEFNKELYHQAIDEYAQRHRRFGGLDQRDG